MQASSGLLRTMPLLSRTPLFVLILLVAPRYPRPSQAMSAAAAAPAVPGGSEALQAEAFQRLYPDQYLAKFVAQGVRPDGRPLALPRATSIGLGVVTTADSSALVKIGSTSVLAGAKCEVMPASADEPDKGRLAVQVGAGQGRAASGRVCKRLRWQEAATCALYAAELPIRSMYGLHVGSLEPPQQSQRPTQCPKLSTPSSSLVEHFRWRWRRCAQPNAAPAALPRRRRRWASSWGPCWRMAGWWTAGSCALMLARQHGPST